jgi:hypothetical protein
MSTNHFILTPQTEVTIVIDLTGCSPEDVGPFFFFGYRTSNAWSRQFKDKDKMLLSVGDESALSFVRTEVGAELVVLKAENLHKNKDLKIRLRSEALGQ